MRATKKWDLSGLLGEGDMKWGSAEEHSSYDKIPVTTLGLSFTELSSLLFTSVKVKS